MKRSMTFATVFLMLLALIGCSTAEAVQETHELTDQMVLRIMSERGYDIYGPRFRVVYNDRLIYGPNFQETVTPSQAETSSEDSPSEAIEMESSMPEMETTVDGEMQESQSEEDEVVFNEPIEHELPNDAFVSEDPEEELDILAQWDAYVAQLPQEEGTAEEEAAVAGTIVEEVSEQKPEDIVQAPASYNETDYISDIGIVYNQKEALDDTVEDIDSEKEQVVVKVYEDEERHVEPFVESPYPLEETEPQVEDDVEQFSKEKASESSNIEEAKAFVVSHRKPLAVGAVFVALVFTAIGRRRRNGRKRK